LEEESRRFAMARWRCEVCDYIYDEAEGLPEEGIAPGTPWSLVPEDWLCPDCGVSKASFVLDDET
jgi:rubredoxin